MSDDGSTLATTTSLCPDCLESVPGRYERREGGVYLTRRCPDHGTTSRQVWGSVDHWEWAADYGPDVEPDGDLTVESDHACLAVVEVTEDCNLSCSYCFASSGPGGTQMDRSEVLELLDVVRQEGPRPIQFSGGEPTVRDDLPELVEAAVEKGFEHVEVNTNGLRLAQEDGYARRLAEAGVTAVYLQFDGLRRETYVEIREADILQFKHEAIEACREADLPVILVPTVVPGVNDDEMGDVVRFALDNGDVVRSVNFQPVAHFGRYEKHDGRFALDEAARLLAEQVDALDARDILPAPCCSAYCQIGTALVKQGDDVVPLTTFVDESVWESLTQLVDEDNFMELLAGTGVGEDVICAAAGCCGVDIEGDGCGDAGDDGRGDDGRGGDGDALGDDFAGVPGAGDLPDGDDRGGEPRESPLSEQVLPVSITGFMDADAADADRLSNCCISVPTPDGDLVPFCGYNMTTDDGEYALRNRHGWGGRDVVDPDPDDHPDPETVGQSSCGSDDASVPAADGDD